MAIICYETYNNVLCCAIYRYAIYKHQLLILNWECCKLVAWWSYPYPMLLHRSRSHFDLSTPIRVVNNFSKFHTHTNSPFTYKFLPYLVVLSADKWDQQKHGTKHYRFNALSYFAIPQLVSILFPNYHLTKFYSV